MPELIWFYSLLAEFLGFVSGVLLLVPALSMNDLLRKVWKARKKFSTPKTVFGKKIGIAAKPILDEASLPNWSLRDQLMLAFGAALLAASFVIKFLIVWLTPVTPT